ncbi:MAG: hypothetical protein ACE5IR_16615 [bacterium]
MTDMKPIRVIVDNAINEKSILWHTFQEWLGDKPAEYLFLEKAHKGIPDVEILDKLLTKSTILLTLDRVLHNRACNRGMRSFTLNSQGQLQKRRLPNIIEPKGPTAPSVLKELKSDYTTAMSELTLKLTNGLSPKELKSLRTRRRRIRSYFGSAANLSSVAMTIDATMIKEKALCGYAIKIAGHARVKGLRASEGYCVTSVAGYDPAYPAIHALCASFYLHLDQVPTELFIISEETLNLCKALMRATLERVTQPSHRALWTMLRGIPELQLSPCIKGYFYEKMKQKLKQLSSMRSNEVRIIDFDEIVRKMNSPLPDKTHARAGFEASVLGPAR